MTDPMVAGERSIGPSIGALVRRLPIRVVDISAAGCLLECAQPVDAGTVALLALRIGERRYVDPVRITRCVRLSGSIRAYRFGAEMLALTPPHEQTLRRLALPDGVDLIVRAPTRSSSAGRETHDPDEGARRASASPIDSRSNG